MANDLFSFTSVFPTDDVFGSDIRVEKIREAVEVEPMSTKDVDYDPGDMYRGLFSMLGDSSLVKRIMQLKQFYSRASTPELVAMDWLDRNSVPYIYQAQAFGGRNISGGLVPDFVIQNGNKGMVWAIQGDYWHTKRYNREIDTAAKMRLLGQVVAGLLITQYVELWEQQIYQHMPEIFILAMAGISMPGGH